MNAMLPFLAAYAAPQTLAPQLASSRSADMTSLFGDSVLICTAEGFKWVSWEDVQTGKERPEPHSTYQCALCYKAGHDSKYIAAPQLVAEVCYGHAHYISYYHTDITMTSQLAGYRFRTRAPPRRA